MVMGFTQAMSVVLIGIVVVFLILCLLIIVVGGIGKLMLHFSLSSKHENTPQQSTDLHVISPSPRLINTDLAEEGDDDQEHSFETVAVICAAVYAAMSSEEARIPHRIHRIKRVGVSSQLEWRQAGLMENTRPF